MVMLNEHQRRGLSITLRIVEETLVNIERLMTCKTYKGSLYEEINNIPAGIKDAVSKRISRIREILEKTAITFILEKEQMQLSRLASGKLPYCWEILENAKSKRLNRYGDVAEGLEDILDPILDGIIEEILEIERILRRV